MPQTSVKFRRQQAAIKYNCLHSSKDAVLWLMSQNHLFNSRKLQLQKMISSAHLTPRLIKPRVKPRRRHSRSRQAKVVVAKARAPQNLKRFSAKKSNLVNKLRPRNVRLQLKLNRLKSKRRNCLKKCSSIGLRLPKMPTKKNLRF